MYTFEGNGTYGRPQSGCTLCDTEAEAAEKG